MTPISATQQPTNSPILETQEGPSHSPPSRLISTQEVKVKILEMNGSIEKLAQQKEDCRTYTTQIKAFISNKTAEITRLKQQTEKLNNTIETLQQNIQQTTQQEHDDSPLILKVNNANKNIYEAHTKINSLKINIQNKENEIKNFLEKEEKKEKAILLLKEDIDSLRKNNKNIQTKESEKREEKMHLGHLEDLQNNFYENIAYMIKDVQSAVEKLKIKNNEGESIKKFQNEAANFVNLELFKRMRSKKEYNSFENISKFLSRHKNGLIQELEEKSAHQLGHFENLKRIQFLSTTLFSSSVLTGFLFFGSEYLLPKKNFLNQETFETKISTFFVLSVISIIAGIVRNKMITSHQEMMIQNIKEGVPFQANKTASIFFSQIELVYQRQALRDNIKRIFENNPPTEKTNPKTWIHELKIKNDAHIEQYQQKIQSTSSDIQTLTTKKEGLELEKADISNRRKQHQDQKKSWEKIINTLHEKIQENEKKLKHVKKNENQQTQTRTENLQRYWRQLKTVQCDLDLCNMHQETIQAQLLNRELLLQQAQDQLQQQEQHVIQLMSQLDLQQIGAQLLRPNMTEAAFARTLNRHNNLSPAQLLQRIQKGHFINNEGHRIHAPTRQASSYSSFYHMLYAIMDAIEFVESKVNNNEGVDTKQNHTIKHDIVVGQTVGGTSSEPAIKQTSTVNYAYRTNPITQQQQLMIDHIF